MDECDGKSYAGRSGVPVPGYERDRPGASGSADEAAPPSSAHAGSLDPGGIVACGRAAGLTLCGIAGCEPSDHAAHLDAWLARGAHGGMEWMARTAAVRKDLRSKWGWARSALVGALSYLTEPRRRDELRGLARYVSRYARGRDYHDVLRDRLAQWVAAVERLVGGSFRRALLVDTSAVLERELAARAGVGWFGKNTCLIGPDGDSWRFLGVVLTDLDLQPSAERLAERCGSCRACLDACPTGAISEPWFVDASRCISYLTIEHRGSIPDTLMGSVGDWLFGCDVCQEVCPWNRSTELAGEPQFGVTDVLERLSLSELVRMDDEEFRSNFRGTPLSRAKRAGMVRNGLVVGANIGDRSVIAAAERLTGDAEPAVARTARWVVESSQNPRSRSSGG